MTILVTGGAGYIGSHMVLALLDAGRKVVVLDDLSTGFRWLVPPQVPFVQGNCGDAELLGEVIREHQIEAIAHFAGSIVVPDSVIEPLNYYFNNTVNSRTLIDSAIKNGVERMIFSSTAAVYGNASVSPIPETATLQPVSPYGASKLMTETMLRDAAAAHPLRYVVLRYFNVAGADPEGRSGQSGLRATHLIKIATQAALRQRSGVEIYGTDYPTPDGTCLRDYIHVSDLANAHLLALDYLSDGGGSVTLNCGYGRGRSVLEVIEGVKRVSRVDFPTRRMARRSGDPATLVAAAGEVQKRLGWRPARDDLDTIIAHALAWERNLVTQQALSA